MPDPTSDRLDSLAYTLARYGERTPRLAFPGGPPEAVAAWRSQARAKLVELLGGFPAATVPLDTVLGEPIKRTGYTRRTVVFATRPGMAAFAHLLVPDKLDGRASAVVCIPGHGPGADDLVGLDAEGKDRPYKDGYQHDYALQCVERGHVVLALEPLGFGHRRDPAARESGPSTSSCQPAAGAALMLGETLLGWRVWDSLRAIDFLATLPEVDPSRVAMMGISGGGTVTLHAAALDDRVKVAVLSCSFCTFRDSIYSVAHCIDNYVPGILRWFEAADLAALIAPRHLFAEAGLDDAIFPVGGVRKALRDAGRAFASQDASAHIDHHVFDGGHVFDGSKALPRMKEWLG
ncbi:MAG TPA: alpha/beta hydrolase family protein [Isosphaeraceae bacterium]